MKGLFLTSSTLDCGRAQVDLETTQVNLERTPMDPTTVWVDLQSAQVDPTTVQVDLESIQVDLEAPRWTLTTTILNRIPALMH